MRVVLFLFLVLWGFNISAEVRFGPLSWVAGEKTLIVLVPKGGATSGIFIGLSDSIKSPQELSPKIFLDGKGRSAFFQFNLNRNVFDALVLSDGTRYPIGGGVTVNIGEARVSVSPGTVNLDQGYWTIVEGDKLVRGFIGLQEIFKYEGSQYIELLEANQANQLSRFEILEKGLMLGGSQFKGARLGLELNISNRCLEQPVVDEAGGSVERSDSWLIYRVLPSAFYVFDTIKEDFGIVKDTGERCIFTYAIKKSAA